MNKQILGKQVTPGQSFSMPALTEVQISVLNTGLNLYKGDVDAFCQAICQLYAQNKRNYLTKDQTDKDMVKVFDMDKLRKRYNRIGTGDRNVKAILTKFNLEEDSGYRELMSITRAFTDGMRELKRNYPNCYEFLEYVDQFGALSSCRADTLKMHSPPVLLAGSPGVGKTAIVQEVAKLLGVGCKQLDMATVTSSFVITGSSSVWSDAKTGCIVDILRDGNAANPIVILDELDKVSRDAKFDPLGGLYTLLEQEAAATFTDEALEMPIDASHILYVATANDLSAIPEPLLSRFLVINIQDVKGAHHRAVTQSIYLSLVKHENMEQTFVPDLHDDVIEAVEPYSPREVKRILIRAMANAAYRQQRSSVVTIDRDDLTLPNQEEIRMGFVW